MKEYQMMMNQIANLRAEADCTPFNIESFNHELYALMLDISNIQSRIPNMDSFEQGLEHIRLTHQVIVDLFSVVDLVYEKNKLMHADLLKHYTSLQLWRNQLHAHMQRWNDIRILVQKLIPVAWHELEQITNMATFTTDPKTWNLVIMD